MYYTLTPDGLFLLTYTIKHGSRVETKMLGNLYFDKKDVKLPTDTTGLSNLEVMTLRDYIVKTQNECYEHGCSDGESWDK